MSAEWLNETDDPEIIAERAKHQAEKSKPNGRYPGETDKTIPLKTGKDFQLQKIDWLWPGWLARGKLHLLAGQKAAGKSTIAFDLLARVSVGNQWPDGTAAELGDVLIWSGEDGIEDTILPRFVAAGGDLARIYPIKNVISAGESRPFDPSTDIHALIEMAMKLPDLKIVVTDPVVLALPAKSDSHKNTETRRGLQPLVDLAEQRGVALIGITHFTKGTADNDPIERVTGSLAFGALPRCVWGATANADGFQRRLVRIASNIGPSGGGIEYTLHQEPLIDFDFSAQRIAWGAKLNGSPNELLNEKKQTAAADAAEFLREILQTGSCPQKEIKDAAEAHGHTWATIRRAQRELGIKPQKTGKTWTWELPSKMSTFSTHWTE
jgi:putative DNA primase/helicase